MIDQFICPPYYTPIVQIGMSFFFGVTMGALSQGLLKSIIWYLISEALFRWAVRKRLGLYCVCCRAYAFAVGIVGILISQRLFQL